MNKSFIVTTLLIILVVLQSVQSVTYYENDIVIKDLKLYVNGKEFFVKGMAYTPAPLGIKSMKTSGYEGGGFCSAKKTVFGEYKSACFGSDYYDSSIDKERDPSGPSDANGDQVAWWSPIWKRDLTKMKELGVNTLRIYNLNTLTKTFFEMYPSEYPDVKDKSVAANHVPFLDYAHKMGYKVIVPIVPDQAFLLNTPEELVNKHIEAQVTEQGNHPALLMYVLGNELDIVGNPKLLALVNKYMKRVRDRTLALWNRRVPVSHAVLDNPQQYEFMVKNLKVDIFVTNAGYRDVNMEPLWVGEQIKKEDGTTYKFPGWKSLSKKYNVPLMIGELGMHQNGDEITKVKPDWFNKQWRSIVTHTDDGTVGGVFFEWSDESHKNNGDQHMGAIILKEATSDGLSSLDKDVFIPDEITEKPIVYNSIKVGHTGSEAASFHMNADVFTLIKRKQTTITVVKRPGAESSDPVESSSPAAESTPESSPQESETATSSPGQPADSSPTEPAASSPRRNSPEPQPRESSASSISRGNLIPAFILALLVVLYNISA